MLWVNGFDVQYIITGIREAPAPAVQEGAGECGAKTTFTVAAGRVLGAAETLGITWGTAFLELIQEVIDNPEISDEQIFGKLGVRKRFIEEERQASNGK